MMKVLCPILESGKIRTLSTAVKDDPILVQIYHQSIRTFPTKNVL